MEFRSSLRWRTDSTSVRKCYQVPFVSKSGKLSANTLYFWKAYPEQVFMSVVSTIYQRLLKIQLKRHKFVGRGLRDCLIKAATIYYINKDDWFLDRLLGITKSEPLKRIRNFVHYFVCELDDNKRFVYSQALHQANWLKFQVFRPADKSSKSCSLGTHLNKVIDDGPGCYDKDFRMTFHELVYSWSVTRIRSSEKRSPPGSPSRELDCFSDYSELYIDQTKRSETEAYYLDSD